MNSKTLHPYLQIIRPVNVAIVFATIIVAGIIAGPSDWDWLWIVVAALSGALIAAGGNAINDYFDLAVDKINRPDRPLPKGVMSRDDAKRIWMYTSASGLVLSLLLGFWCLLIAAVWVGGLYLYSERLKGTVLIGNVAVALMTALAFPYGAIVVGRPSLGSFPALFAFLANLARELIKDVEDVDGDATVNAETLAVKHGTGAGLLAASIVLAVLILVTFVPVIVGVYNYTYLLIILIVDLGLGYVGLSHWYDATHINLRRLSLVLKMCMVGGLVAILVGSS
jgi:geranylgeranylglycerol-phosphate geranylgeranyltransferase